MDMNLPNRITLARICLIPIFMIILLTKHPFGTIGYDQMKLTYNELIAFLIFVIAASTDGLDGYLARKKKMVTDLGKLLDPLADKLLVSAAFVSLVQMQRIDAWIAIVIISREFLVTGLRMIGVANGVVIAASGWGKLKTVLHIVSLALLIINNVPFKYFGIPLDQIAIWSALIVTVISGIDYFWKNKHVIKSI